MILSFRRSFLFDHLPKTGGTAWRTVLEELFGRENVTPHLEGRSEIWAVQRYSGFKVISGHFLSLLPGDAGGGRRVRVTLLREPVDRAISEYYYWRHHANEGVADRLGQWAQQYDICDFFRARAESNETAATNFCTRHFASRISRDLADERKLLSLAVQSLDSYGFTGIYECLGDSADLFCWKFGLLPIDEVPRVNVTRSRTAVSDLDPRTRRDLAEMNHLDVQLYDHALAAFQAEKRRMFRELITKHNRTRILQSGGSSTSARGRTGRHLRAIASIFEGASKEAAPVDQREADAPSLGGNLRKQESFGSGEVEIVAAQVIGEESATNEVAPGETASLCVSIRSHADVQDLVVGVELSDSFGEVVFGTNSFLSGATRNVTAGRDYDVIFRFAVNLNRGRYAVGVALHTGANHAGRCFHWRDNVTMFDVVQFGEPDFVGYCRLEPIIEWRNLDSAPVELDEGEESRLSASP